MPALLLSLIPSPLSSYPSEWASPSFGDRERRERRSRSAPARGGWPSGVLQGPQAEPGTSLPAAAARPRLRLGSQRGSAWGAAATGSAGPSSEAAGQGARGPGRAGEPRPGSSLPPDARSAGPLPQARSPRQKAEEREATLLPGRAPRGARRYLPAPASPGEGAPAPRASPQTRGSAGGAPPARHPGLRRCEAALHLRGPQSPSDFPAPTKRGHYYFFFSLGSSKFQASSQALRTHPAFPQVTRIFLDINFRGPGNMSPGCVPPDSPSGLGPQTHWAFSPRLLTVLYTLLRSYRSAHRQCGSPQI